MTRPDSAAALVLTAPTLAPEWASQATPIGWLSSPRGGADLLVRGRLRRRVPGLPLQLQHIRFQAARHRGGREAGPRRGKRSGRGGDRRPRRADCGRPDRRAPQRARALPRPPLGAPLAGRGRVARLLVAEARLPRRVARPLGQGRTTRRGLGGRDRRVRLRRPERRARLARGRADPFLARASVQALAASAASTAAASSRIAAGTVASPATA